MRSSPAGFGKEALLAEKNRILGLDLANADR